MDTPVIVHIADISPDFHWNAEGKQMFHGHSTSELMKLTPDERRIFLDFFHTLDRVIDNAVTRLSGSFSSLALYGAKDASGRWGLIHPSTHVRYKDWWQLTRFGPDNEPWGHNIEKTRIQAIHAAIFDFGFNQTIEIVP